MNNTDHSKKDCLLLSVTVLKRGKKHISSEIETNCRDYPLADGSGVPSYLGSSNGVMDYVRGIGPNEFRDLVMQEPIPQDLRPAVRFQPVKTNGKNKVGVYAQIFLCDLGTGGAIQTVHAQSKKYRCVCE